MNIPEGFSTLTPCIFTKLEMQVADVPYGDCQTGVLDPFGNIWWISQRLLDAPYSS